MIQPGHRGKHRLQRVLCGVFLISAASYVLLLVTGGFDASIAGIRLTAHAPERPLLLAAVSLVAYFLLGGDIRTPLKKTYTGPLRGLELATSALARFGPPELIAASVIAALLGGVGFVYGAKVAGGSDSYGYVSQAELWLAGGLSVQQPFVEAVPWPNGAATFTPLGYRPSEREGDPWSIVPVYAPGLSLMLAAAKLVGGQTAMFCVVPISSVLLVLATFGIGQRVGSPGAGLVGAWLVATSPIVLYMVTATMTDVPVAGLWAAAFYLLLGRSGASAFGSGLCAGAAVLVRPNMVPLAAVMGLLYAVRFAHRAERRSAFWHGIVFSLGVLPGIAAVAIFNSALYGSPFLSGYGDVSTWFRLSNVGPNLQRYLGWLVQTQTVLAVMGLVAVFVPSRRLWTAARERRELVVMALFVLVSWLVYLLYAVFDAWWYLRFILSSWPFILIGTGVVAVWIVRRGGGVARVVAFAALAGLGGYQCSLAYGFGAFEMWRAERRYIAGGQLVARLTEANSVVLSMQHSGSVRYYGGRVTLRYDQMPEDWIDPAVDWLAAHGVHTYVLVEDWERAEIARRFPGTRTARTLTGPPMATADEGGLFLFDVSSPRGESETPERVSGIVAGLAGIDPAAPPQLVFRR